MKRVLVFLLLAVGLDGPLASGEGPSHPPSRGGFASAKVCGSCHEAIYEGWKGSMHANAVKDPIFYAIFLETSRETGGKSDPLCLSCHAPTTRLTKNLRLDDPLTAEGVSCDFCHSIRDVKIGGANQFDLDVGPVKRGPLKDVVSPQHKTMYSPLHVEARLCAGCHEFTNERGVPILSTYSEWKESPQAKEGQVCQTCHMPELKGLVVPPRVMPTREVYINSHEAAGGHSLDQVRKAIRVAVGEVKRSEDKVHAVVVLENVGSGHKVPTGLPTRKLVLRFEARAGGTVIFTEERVFQKVVLDTQGNEITRDADLFLKAARIRSDNRLEPGKPRQEVFTFFAPRERKVEIEATAFYLYQPKIFQETEMRIEIGNGRATLPKP